MKKNSPFVNNERFINYKDAMAKYPRARINEIKGINNLLGKKYNEILEIGSGGGYLTNYLVHKCSVIDTIDVNSNKDIRVRNSFVSNLANGLPESVFGYSYDLCISLATFHHLIENENYIPESILNGVYEILKPGSKFIIIDVPNVKNSHLANGNQELLTAVESTSKFFSQIVDIYSTPPHNGVYLDIEKCTSDLREKWIVAKKGHIYCPWVFDDSNSCLEFLIELFNLDSYDENFSLQISKHLFNTLISNDHQMLMRWALSFLILQKI